MLLVATLCLCLSPAQEIRPSPVRLIRLQGSFGKDVPIKSISGERYFDGVIELSQARLESEPLSFLTRVWSSLTVVNKDSSRKITEIEWRLDIHDESLGILSRRVFQVEKVRVDSEQSARVSANFAAVLPDRMLILLQLTRVSFAEGLSRASPVECTLEKDMLSVTCRSK
jgi:hypothetical protein